MASGGRHEAAVEKRASPGGVVAVVLFGALAVAAVVTIVYRQNQGTSAPAQANTVVMAKIAFSPKTLTAAKGSEILFVNKDVAPHNVTADDPQISSGTITPGQTFRLVVQQPFEYRCTIHPGMDAKVVLAG